MPSLEHGFRSRELFAPVDKTGGVPSSSSDSEQSFQRPLNRPELTGKQARRFAQPAVSIEEANVLMDAIPWELLESSHAGRARKQLLEAVRTILPDLDGHN